ncbi:MAG TPA: helix-turn-helix domain-containing protein, partial [Spirochaetota bacterium]|nr:helix-turn-helix domain-containing protein [Spirochaetota bacterium]
MIYLAIKLEKIGFTKTEARVYITLLKNGSLNGYQIAKILNLSRSSVYLALDNLCNKNMIYLIPGEINEYKAENPDNILNKVTNDFNENISQLKIELTSIASLEPEEKFFNIWGIENVIEKVKDIIRQAEKEICINTNLNPFIFEKEIKNANKKGIRIILFSVSFVDIKDLPVEY